MKSTDYTGIAYLVAIAGAAALVWFVLKQSPAAVGKGIADAATGAAGAIADTISNAADKITQTVTGNPSTSLGSTIYDMTHGDEGTKLVAPVIVKKPAPADITPPDPADGKARLDTLTPFIF